MHYEKELFSMELVVGFLVSCICCIWSMAGNEGVIMFCVFSLKDHTKNH